MFMFENVASNAMLVTLHGEIDMANAPSLRRGLKLAQQTHSVIVVNLARCRYIDSCGVGVLLETRLAIGSRLRVVLPGDHAVKRVFDILKLESILVIVSTVEDALAIAS